MKDKTIKGKFFLTIYLIILISTILINAVVFLLYRYDIEQKIDYYGTQSIEVLSINISRNIINAEENLTYKINDTALFFSNEPVGLNVNSKEMKAFVALVRNSGMNVKTCYVKKKNDSTEYWSDGNVGFGQYKRKLIWNMLEKVESGLNTSRGTTIWRRFPDSPESIYIIKNIIDYENMNKQALLCLEIDRSYFDSVKPEDSLPIVIKDENNDLLYCTEGVIYSNNTNHLQEKYITMVSMISKKNWQIIGLVEKNNALSNLRHLLVYITLIELFILLISIFISNVAVNAITANIHALIRGMKQVSEGKTISIIKAKSNDETAFLVDTFNELNKRLNETVNQLIYNQMQTEKAKYHALTAQLNPHFLYNSLASISGMAKLNNQEDIVRAISSLSKLLRACLSDSNDMNTVEAELDYVSQYLSLESMITGGQLNWIIECDAEIKKFRIPKLILQPIVENSIIHGFKDMVEEAVICIIVKANNGNLSIEISDNGCGLSEEDKERILSDVELVKTREARNHIGLKSVQQRIKYLFGEEYGVTIDTSGEIGLTVIMTMPCTGEDDVQNFNCR